MIDPEAGRINNPIGRCISGRDCRHRVLGRPCVSYAVHLVILDEEKLSIPVNCPERTSIRTDWAFS